MKGRTRSGSVAAHTFPYEVLVVGAVAENRGVIEACVSNTIRYCGTVSIRFKEHLPRHDLLQYHAILLDSGRPISEWMALFADPEVASRSRILVNADRVSPETALATRLPAVVVGQNISHTLTSREIERLLVNDPLSGAIGPLLDHACSPEQAKMVMAFVSHPEILSLRDATRVFARSRRSLDRDCSMIGLNPPHVLLQVVRVCRGLVAISQAGANVDAAAAVAGYTQTSAFRRVARITFAERLSVLLSAWRTYPHFAQHLQRALIRHR